MKILVVANLELSYPPTTGNELRVFNLLKWTAQQHEVSFISLSYPRDDSQAAVDYLRTFCKYVEVVPPVRRSKWQRRWLLLQWLFKGEPLRNVNYFSPKMRERIKTLTASESFDVVHFHRIPMVPYIDAVEISGNCRKILSLHDIDFVRFRRNFRVDRQNWGHKLRTLYLDLLFSKRATLKYARRFDTCVVVSDVDRDILAQAGVGLDIAVVPNGVDAREYAMSPGLPSAPILVFVGKMSYSPNVDAMIFFCDEIFPLIKQQVPNAKLYIVGKEPVSIVRVLASEDVTVTGYVESVIPYYQQALLSIVPLRAGGGTRLKILESMALGRPVVSTTIGCEGLEVSHGEDILIADTPEDFAESVVQLIHDDALCQRLVQGGRQLVDMKYDWQVIASQLDQVYKDNVQDEKIHHYRTS
jgi:polysaccharide biosynthesis protein PslH